MIIYTARIYLKSFDEAMTRAYFYRAVMMMMQLSTEEPAASAGARRPNYAFDTLKRNIYASAFPARAPRPPPPPQWPIISPDRKRVSAGSRATILMRLTLRASARRFQPQPAQPGTRGLPRPISGQAGRRHGTRHAAPVGRTLPASTYIDDARAKISLRADRRHYEISCHEARENKKLLCSDT